MNKKKEINEIRLTTEQREELLRFTTTGVHSARLIRRAKVILMLDASENGKSASFAEISEKERISSTSIQMIRRNFQSARTIDEFLTRKKRETPPVPSKITGDVEAHIVALACGKPPEGYARWSLRLLANKSVELKLIDSISHNAVKEILKKRNLSLT